MTVLLVAEVSELVEEVVAPIGTIVGRTMRDLLVLVEVGKNVLSPGKV